MNEKKKQIIYITLIGIIVNVILSVIKIIVGYVGNSGAMIADGIHSFSDLISDGIVIFAAKYSQQPPDKEHPYGHGRFETIAILSLSIILFIIAIGIFINAIFSINNTEQLSYSVYLVAVATITILSKEALYIVTIIVAKKLKSNMLKANAWHHRSDALSSIVVLIGIIGSIYGYPYLDAIAAMIVAVIIGYMAWGLLLSSLKEFIDTTIDSKKLYKIKKEILQIDDVIDIHSLRARTIGSNVAMDMHIQVDKYLSVSEAHMISLTVEQVAKKCCVELDDIVVHIDVENDNNVILYKNIPTRKEVINIFNNILAKSAYDKYITNITLHYLQGKIHIDFYFRIDSLKENNQNNITIFLQQAAKKYACFGNIRLYFS